jgi:hypothetical protein
MSGVEALPSSPLKAKNGLQTVIAGSLAYLGISLGAMNDAPNRTGFYADFTPAAEKLHMVVGGVSTVDLSGGNLATGGLVVKYTTPATSAVTGALRVEGGVGVAGNVFANGYVRGATGQFGGQQLVGASLSAGGAGVLFAVARVNNPNGGGLTFMAGGANTQLFFTGDDPSLTPSAHIVGRRSERRLRIGTGPSFGDTTSALFIDESNNVRANFNLGVAATTAATDTTTGALTVAGGVGVGGDAFVGNSLHVNPDAAANQNIYFSNNTANTPSANFGSQVAVSLTPTGIALPFTAGINPYARVRVHMTDSGVNNRLMGTFSYAEQAYNGVGPDNYAGVFYSRQTGNTNAAKSLGVYAHGLNVSSAADSKSFGGYLNATGGEIAYGVYATASGAATNYAGWFEGHTYVNGKLTVTGLIDPTGLQFDPVAVNPGTANTLWVDSENSDTLMFGATPVIGGGGGDIGGSIAVGQVAYGAGEDEIAGSNNFTYATALESGGLSIANTTPSTSTTTGALKVSGGVGIAGRVTARQFYASETGLAYSGQLVINNAAGQGSAFGFVSYVTVDGDESNTYAHGLTGIAQLGNADPEYSDAIGVRGKATVSDGAAGYGGSFEGVAADTSSVAYGIRAFGSAAVGGLARAALFTGAVVHATGDYYFGDPLTEGSWRIKRDGDDLVFQRLESSTWVTKSTITAGDPI